MKTCEVGTLPYMQFVADGAERHRRGERQLYCQACCKWVWPSNVAEDHAKHVITAKQFERLKTQAAKLARRMEAQ